MEIIWKDIKGFDGEYQISNSASFRKKFSSLTSHSFENISVFFTKYSKYGRVILESEKVWGDNDYLVEQIFKDTFKSEIKDVLNNGTKIFIPGPDDNPVVDEVHKDDTILWQEMSEWDSIFLSYEARNYGVSQLLYENRKLKEEVSWENKKRHGWSKTWHQNGVLKSQQFFINGEAKDVVKTWDENGELMNGIEQLFYDNGVLESLSTYKDGKLNGVCMRWYDNGFLKWKGHYTEGKAEGRFTEYDEIGYIISQAHYNNDHFDGERVEWLGHEVGDIIRSIEHYKDGKLDGKQTLYDEEGKNPSHTWYKNGIRIKDF